MNNVFIALGSNLGDSIATLNDAMECLENLSTKPLRRSSIWESTPVGCPPGSPLFVNAVVAMSPFPGETPESMLQELQALEKEFGRRPKLVVNEPRTLDLDLIAWDSLTRWSNTLIVPHPRAHLRRFVLEPLREIAPELVLPGQRLTVTGLLEGLETGEVLKRLA